MYNDIVLIFLCIFAVYGVYSVFREIEMLLCRRNRIAAAIKISLEMDENRINEAIVFAQNCVYSYSFLERAPVIICDRENADCLQKYGYDVYVKFAEER